MGFLNDMQDFCVSLFIYFFLQIEISRLIKCQSFIQCFRFKPMVDTESYFFINKIKDEHFQHR